MAEVPVTLKPFAVLAATPPTVQLRLIVVVLETAEVGTAATRIVQVPLDARLAVPQLSV